MESLWEDESYTGGLLLCGGLALQTRDGHIS